jgi:ACS family tartrate transporter-like MFS transporter
LSFALLLGAVGVGFSGLMPSPVLVLALLCVGQFGLSAVPALFWPIPSTFMIGASSAAAIAAVNSLGNLSGYFGPQIMGYLKDQTGTFTAGLMVLGGFALVGAVMALGLKTNIAERAVSAEAMAVH